jgi:hypothetical protein
MHRCPILASVLLVLGMSPALQAEPAAGLWQESSRVIAGGMTVQSVRANACYQPGAHVRADHVQAIARRLIDGSCTAVSASSLDPSHFVVRCGGDAFGDGDAVVTDIDDDALTIDIHFRDAAAGGIDTDYATDARRLGPQCSPP